MCRTVAILRRLRCRSSLEDQVACLRLSASNRRAALTPLKSSSRVRTFKGFASSRHRHKAFESLESFRIVLSYGRIVAAMAMLLANLLLAALAAGQSLTPGTGRIVGRVVDAETGAPVAGVRVYLNGPVSPTAPWPPGPLPLPPPVAPQGRQTPATPPPQPDASFFLTL